MNNTEVIVTEEGYYGFITDGLPDGSVISDDFQGW